MKSWFMETLNSVRATLLEHRAALEQLGNAMGQVSYANELQVQALIAVQVVLDEAYMALGDAFSRLTAAHALTNSTSRLVPAGGGKVRAAPHIADASQHVQVAQESLKCLNVHVRAMVVLFTSETTKAGLVGNQVDIARGLVGGILVRWDRALVSIANARDEFN